MARESGCGPWFGDGRSGCQRMLHLIAGVEARANSTLHTVSLNLGSNNHIKNKVK